MYNDKKQKKLRKILRRNQTKTEYKLWQYLRRRQLGGYKFLRQYSIDKYIIDFYCPRKRLAIEIDGGQHFKETKEYDIARDEFLETKNIKVIRFWNFEIFQNIEGVLFEIRKELGLEK